MLTSREFSEAEVLHGASGDQRFLWVVEDVGKSVHTHMEVGDVHSHSLLAHGTLIRVTRRLVVIREWNNAGTYALTKRRRRRRKIKIDQPNVI